MDFNDELREYNFRMNNPEKFVEPKTEICDCCLTQQEDFRLSPDEYGFTCVECIGRTFDSSLAVKKFRETTSHSEIELRDWFDSLKVVK